MIYAVGATSVSIDVLWLDDSGLPVTGKVAADFTACKWSSGTNTADTTITLSDLAAITTAHPNDNTAGGIKEREGGVYRLDLPNNVFTAAGHKAVVFAYAAGKNVFPLSPVDVQSVQVNVIQVNGTAQTARDLGASVLLSSGTGTGQIILSSGTVSLTSPPGIRKNVALANFTFPMISSSDHVGRVTGATVTVTLSIDGAAFGASTNSASEIGTTGNYKINLAAADLNGTVICFKASATSCDDTEITIITQP